MPLILLLYYITFSLIKSLDEEVKTKYIVRVLFFGLLNLFSPKRSFKQRFESKKFLKVIFLGILVGFNLYIIIGSILGPSIETVIEDFGAELMIKSFIASAIFLKIIIYLIQFRTIRLINIGLATLFAIAFTYFVIVPKYRVIPSGRNVVVRKTSATKYSQTQNQPTPTVFVSKSITVNVSGNDILFEDNQDNNVDFEELELKFLNSQKLEKINKEDIAISIYAPGGTGPWWNLTNYVFTYNSGPNDLVSRILDIGNGGNASEGIVIERGNSKVYVFVIFDGGESSDDKNNPTLYKIPGEGNMYRISTSELVHHYMANHHGGHDCTFPDTTSDNCLLGPAFLGDTTLNVTCVSYEPTVCDGIMASLSVN